MPRDRSDFTYSTRGCVSGHPTRSCVSRLIVGDARQHAGSPSHFCEVVVLTLRTWQHAGSEDADDREADDLYRFGIVTHNLPFGGVTHHLGCLVLSLITLSVWCRHS